MFLKNAHAQSVICTQLFAGELIIIIFIWESLVTSRDFHKGSTHYIIIHFVKYLKAIILRLIIKTHVPQQALFKNLEM